MPNAFLVASLILAAAAPAAAPDFSAHWHDGRAELDGYRLTVSRYGEDRAGTAVMIFVTEPFSESKRVKVDDPSRDPADTFDALKLNLVRDFQTGVYDYNTMTSIFVRSDDFSPVKVSFSSQEWCGNVYEEQIFGGDRIESRYMSYFEGESGETQLTRPKDGIAEDALYIRLRDLRGEALLSPGQSKRVPFLPGAFVSRLTHKPAAWTTAELSRERGLTEVTVPAGTFRTTVYHVKVDGGREGAFYIEDAYPHRIVAWNFTPDVRGELTGTVRTAYWTQNGNGNEALLKDLGLR